MDGVLKALECDISGRSSIQDCLRIIRQPLKLPERTDRSTIRTVKAVISSRHIGSLLATNDEGFADSLQHIIVTIRFLQYLLEFSELQEPEKEGAEPQPLILSTNGSIGEDVIRCVQSTIQGIVSVVSKRLEQSDNDEEEVDADELFERDLQKQDSSLHCRNLQLAYFLQGSLSLLFQNYTNERPWLVPAILNPYASELLRSDLPTPLRHHMVRLLCDILDQATAAAKSAPTHLLQYMLKHLKLFAVAETVDIHLPTVLCLWGSMDHEDPLIQELHWSLTNAIIRMDDDSERPFFTMGKLRALLQLLKTPSATLQECLEEILLRTLPTACFAEPLRGPQRLFVIRQALEGVAPAVVPDSFYVICLKRATHPLSVELCGQLITATTSRLVLAARLVVDVRTVAVLRRRLVSILMRVPADRVEVAKALQSKKKIRELCQSRNALASVLPLLGHFNVVLAPPHAQLLTGPFLKKPLSKLDLCSALQKAYGMFSQQKRCDFHQLLDCVLLPCSHSNDEEVLAGLFRVITLAGPFVNERFPEVYRVLLAKQDLLQAKTIALLLNFSSALSKQMRSHLPHCTEDQKEIRDWIRQRLNDNLYNPEKLDVDRLKAKASCTLLENLPSRNAAQRMLVSEGSLILQMPTQQGRSAIVIFPPTDDSRRDIDYMLGGATLDVMQLEHMSAFPGGFQLHINPSTKSDQSM